MKLVGASILVAAAALTACSGIPRHETDQQLLARYSSYAGEPVSEIRSYTRFNSWSPIDNQHVLIETNVNEAYLLTVDPTCFDLSFATRLGVVSHYSHTISSGFDSLRVGRETCRITEIRPVNYKQMRADLKAQQQKG